MKRIIYEAPTCDPNHVVTQSDLDALERHLDKVWNKLGIDIAFTRHFLDRVNDARNGKQITLCELARIFLETFRQHGKKLTGISTRDWEAVLSDKITNVNVPFVLKHNGKEVEIVAKTVMRKPNFHTPDPKLVVAHFRQGDNKMSKTLREWTGLGLPQNDPVAGVYAVDDVDVNPSQIDDPEVLTMLNGFLASLTKKTFINPYYPVQQAFAKLSAVGLSFQLRGLDLGGDTGVVLIPVSHFGGRLGRNLDGSWADNDGISEKIPGGIFLKVTYTQTNGEFVVNMQLVPAEEGVELDTTDIEEDVTTGTSDATTDEYPFDSDFQPTQDGETIFDAVNFESFIQRGRKIAEAANSITVKPSTRKKGMYDVIVGNIPRVTKPTVKGANGYASRIAKENPHMSFTPLKEAELNEADAKVVLNIPGVPSNYANLPLGRKMDHHAAIKKFKDEAKRTHFGAKGKPIMKAFGEFKRLNNVSQWYFLDRGPQGMKDDSVEIWYK